MANRSSSWEHVYKQVLTLQICTEASKTAENPDLGPQRGIMLHILLNKTTA